MLVAPGNYPPSAFPLTMDTVTSDRAREARISPEMIGPT
jgi:hypothetical protein